MRDRAQRWHHYWNKQSRGYDRQMRFFDRVLFGDSRQWACARATGETLEVAIGTGLNLTAYPGHVTLTGIDLSEDMLAIARTRAADLDRPVTLVQGNAHTLPFDDATFDSVVCTFGLCAIPDPEAAIGEMHRVLRPGGRMILVDHIESSSRIVRAAQRLLEKATVPLAGEHFLRRPRNQLRAAGFAVDEEQRFKLGIVERLTATR